MRSGSGSSSGGRRSSTPDDDDSAVLVDNRSECEDDGDSAMRIAVPPNTRSVLISYFISQDLKIKLNYSNFYSAIYGRNFRGAGYA